MQAGENAFQSFFVIFIVDGNYKSTEQWYKICNQHEGRFIIEIRNKRMRLLFCCFVCGEPQKWTQRIR